MCGKFCVVRSALLKLRVRTMSSSQMDFEQGKLNRLNLWTLVLYVISAYSCLLFLEHSSKSYSNLGLEESKDEEQSPFTSLSTLKEGYGKDCALDLKVPCLDVQITSTVK